MICQKCIQQMIIQANNEDNTKLADVLTILSNKSQDELEMLFNVCVDLYQTNDRTMNITSKNGPTMYLSERADFALVANIIKYILEH